MELEARVASLVAPQTHDLSTYKQMPSSPAPATPAINLKSLSRLFSALDSEMRLHILLLLRERDYFVYELVDVLDASQPLVSQHLRILKEHGFVESERRGRQVVYHLCTPEIGELVDAGQLFLNKVGR